jgi:hypothetical protein
LPAFVDFSAIYKFAFVPFCPHYFLLLPSSPGAGSPAFVAATVSGGRHPSDTRMMNKRQGGQTSTKTGIGCIVRLKLKGINVFYCFLPVFIDKQNYF